MLLEQLWNKAWNHFGPNRFLSVKPTGSQLSVLPVRIGSLIVHITTERLGDVSGSSITTVLGEPTSCRAASQDLLSIRVGGIVSETDFKLFIQFVSYTAVYCCFVLVFMAVFVAEMMAEVSLFGSIRSNHVRFVLVIF